MEGYEIDACMDSMRIIIDTREQPSERAERRYKCFSVPYERKKLDYGDYSAEFVLPDGSTARLFSAIERKMDLDELEGCLTHDRDRFRREFERAAASHASVYLLVENASWENLLAGHYRTRMNPKAFLASVMSWMVRYDFKPIFCKSEISGFLIEEILRRELKHQLERGDYG